MRRWLLSILAVLMLAAPAQAVVYLCPVDGDGSDVNPHRSRAISEWLPGRGNVELRPDPTSQAGYMLCESDALPSNMAGVTVIGNDRADVLSGPVRAAILSEMGSTIRGGTVEDAIKELVIPTLPRPAKGDYEIQLGTGRPAVKEVASLSNEIYYKGLAVALKEWGASAVASAVNAVKASPAWAAILSIETFNCANAGTLTCVHTWGSKEASSITIVSNQASRSGVLNYAADYADAAVATVDHEVSATFVNAAHSGGGTNTTCSIMGRTTNDATHTYYRTVVAIQQTGEINSIGLIRTISESSTLLATDTTDWVANDVLAIRPVGSTISSRKNGVQILSVTDGNITTGLYGGLRYFSDHSSGQCTWDNWQMRDLPDAFGPLRRRIQ